MCLEYRMWAAVYQLDDDMPWANVSSVHLILLYARKQNEIFTIQSQRNFNKFEPLDFNFLSLFICLETFELMMKLWVVSKEYQIQKLFHFILLLPEKFRNIVETARNKAIFLSMTLSYKKKLTIWS